jgi:hypothetical protein
MYRTIHLYQKQKVFKSYRSNTKKPGRMEHCSRAFFVYEIDRVGIVVTSYVLDFDEKS